MPNTPDNLLGQPKARTTGPTRILPKNPPLNNHASVKGYTVCYMFASGFFFLLSQTALTV